MIRKPAPTFRTPAYFKGEFTDIDLTEYRGTWVVLFFYPADFTFICPTEILEFSKRKAEFDELNAVVIGGSTDSEHSHKAWCEAQLGELTYPLIADKSLAISRAYDVLIEEEGIDLRGTFIIDPEGVLRWMVVHDNSVGRSVTETLRVLKGFQTGELCPVEWTPGEKTLGKA